MYQVAIISHGRLAEELLKSAEMILGTQEDVLTFGLFPGESPETLREHLLAALEQHAGESWLILTDIRSGSPFNVAVGLMEQYPFRHISGVNLAMLIETLANRDDMDVDEAAAKIMALSSQTILDVNKFLES